MTVSTIIIKKNTIKTGNATGFKKIILATKGKSKDMILNIRL